MRRWIRQSVQQVQQGDQRLNDILSALQASPNGVVLLDAQGRIEWCNQIAAKQFGFDAERDVLQSIGNLVRNPQFSAYFVAQDFTHDLVMQGAKARLRDRSSCRFSSTVTARDASCCWRAM